MSNTNTNWEDQLILPEKDSTIEYAYIKKDTVHTCSEEGLYWEIENENVSYVATPDHSTFIIPGTDYKTFLPLAKRRKKRLKSDILLTLFFTIILGFSVILDFYDHEFAITQKQDYLFFLAVGLIPLIHNLISTRAIRGINETNFEKEAQEIKFMTWLSKKKDISVTIFCGVLVVLSILQFFFGLGKSIEIAGLVKTKVYAGEYYRLLTATLLHGSFIHIAFNVLSLHIIGSIVVKTTGYAYMMIVFLVSGLLGSICSTLLLDATSIGASGGIMGLVGFMIILAYKLKTVPRNILRSMVDTIIYTGIIGLFANNTIDNAAHAGGLVGGLLLGMLLIKKHKNMIPYTPTKSINIAGYIATAILLLGVIIIVVKINPF